MPLLLLPVLSLAQSRPFNGDVLQEDIRYLQQALYEIHPSPFRYNSRDSLDHLFAALENTAGSGMTLLAFEQEINKILTSVGCIHTDARRKLHKVKKGTPRARIIPFEFFTDGENLWTTRSPMDTFHEYEWQKILDMDGYETKTLLGKLMAYHPSDGYNTTFMTRLLSRGANFSKLYQGYFDTDSLVQFTFLANGADTTKAHIPKLSPPSGSPSPKEAEKDKKWDYSVKNHFFREEEKWAVLKINSFNPYKLKTRKFYRDIFKTLQEKGTSHLVIDVRDNLGGSITDANMVLRHILDEHFVILLERKQGPTFKYSNALSKFHFLLFSVKRGLECRKKYQKDGLKIKEFKVRVSRKNNFDGEVYLITNGYSASSSSYLASLLKYKKQAIVIGEESGGGAAGNNGLYYTTVQLPNTRIHVRVPFYWLNYQLIRDEGRGVMPDVPIRYHIEDLKQKKDLEMDWIRANLNTGQ